MGNKKIAAIITTVVILAIIIGVGYVIIDNMRHNSYCSNWSTSIEQQRQELESNLFYDPTQFNQEVADFNRECAF